MKLQFAFAAIFVLFVGCSTTPPKDRAATYAEALIRHELAHTDSYMGSNRKFQYFVTVDGKDPSAIELARLSDTGVHFYPGTRWDRGNRLGMQLSISAPSLLPGGNFQVHHDYYCGERCGSSNVAVMQHDGSGWHVVNSVLQSISQREMPNNSFKPNTLRGGNLQRYFSFLLPPQSVSA